MVDKVASSVRFSPAPRMKIMFKPAGSALVAATLALTSCGAVKNSVAAVERTSKATGAKMSALADRINPPDVKIVEVHEKDLKKLPTGEERVLAFEQSRKRHFWSGFSSAFSGPVDFVEPNLPADGELELDDSLLPPKAP